MYNLEDINKQLDLTNMPDKNNFPDPLLHKQLSFIKSGLRIMGCGMAILFGTYLSAFGLLMAAEIVGVIEEMV
jgi:hypothetical protein